MQMDDSTPQGVQVSNIGETENKESSVAHIDDVATSREEGGISMAGALALANAEEQGGAREWGEVHPYPPRQSAETTSSTVVGSVKSVGWFDKVKGLFNKWTERDENPAPAVESPRTPTRGERTPTGSPVRGLVRRHARSPSEAEEQTAVRNSALAAFGIGEHDFDNVPPYEERQVRDADDVTMPELFFWYGFCKSSFEIDQHHCSLRFVVFPIFWILGALYLRIGLKEEHNPLLLQIDERHRQEVKKLFRAREKKWAWRSLIALIILVVVVISLATSLSEELPKHH